MTELHSIDLTHEQPTEDGLLTLPRKPYHPIRMRTETDKENTIPSRADKGQASVGNTETVAERSTFAPLLGSENPVDARENTRSRIALMMVYTLAGLLLVTVLFTFLLIFLRAADSMDDVIAILQGIGSALVTPMVGLIGAVTGFYYGGQTTAQTAAQAAAQTAAHMGTPSSPASGSQQ